jgi:hypothetical protein
MNFPQLFSWLTRWHFPEMGNRRKTAKPDSSEYGQQAPQGSLDLHSAPMHSNFRHWTWFNRSSS